MSETNDTSATVPFDPTTKQAVDEIAGLINQAMQRAEELKVSANILYMMLGYYQQHQMNYILEDNKKIAEELKAVEKLLENN